MLLTDDTAMIPAPHAGRKALRLPLRRPWRPPRTPRRRAAEVLAELTRVNVALLALDERRRALDAEYLAAQAAEGEW